MTTEPTQTDGLLRKKILFASGHLKRSIELFSIAEKNGCGSVDLITHAK